MPIVAFEPSVLDGDRWTAASAVAVALCFVVNMLDGMNILVMSYIAPTLGREWSVTSSQLSIVFSAGLFGMAFGGFLGAPAADRFGRRVAILGALAIMALGMLGCSFARDLATLSALRFVVGLGIGTVLPAMAALAAEIAPQRHRSYAVGLVQAGYPLAAVFTGFAAGAALPVIGWRPLLLGASLLTAALLPLVYAGMPKHRAASERDDSESSRLPLSTLLQGEYRLATPRLWVGIFAGFMVLYFIVSWIPTLSIAAGLSQENAIYAGALYNLGAFAGTVAMSILSIRFPLRLLIPCLLVPAAAALLAFGSLSLAIVPTLALAFVIGVTLQGGFNGIYPLAASIYPSALRATGIGWAMGVGRVGAILGPLLGGVLMTAKTPLPILFGTFAAPLLICALVAYSNHVTAAD